MLDNEKLLNPLEKLFSKKDRIALFYISQLSGIGASLFLQLISYLTFENISPYKFLKNPQKYYPINNPLIKKVFFKLKQENFDEKDFRIFLSELEKHNIRWLLKYEKNYPYIINYFLRDSSPSAIFLKGNIELLKNPLIAMIGSRQAGDWGNNNTQKIAHILGEKGMTVISGAAIGIDTSAHIGVLQGGGNTIFVPARPLFNFNPAENMNSLFTEDNHLFLSPFPPNQKTTKDMPVRRNDIVASLASSVIVGECGLKGGSSYVINFALKNKIPIYVLTDSSNKFKNTPQGNKSLISCGATPIEVSDSKKLLAAVKKIIFETNKYHKNIQQIISSERKSSNNYENKDLPLFNR